MSWKGFCNLLWGDSITNLNNKLDEFISEIEKDKERAYKLEIELNRVRNERDRFKNLVIAVGNTIPDLMWAKDLNGNYIYANKAIAQTLFYGFDKKAILGRNDIELTKLCKELAGDKNHTFGEICANSDIIVLDKLTKQRFLEYGKVGGKDIYLEVYKAPFYNKSGKLLGTVGTGRDVTEWYLGIKDAITQCGNCTGNYVNNISKELDKYIFEG